MFYEVGWLLVRAGLGTCRRVGSPSGALTLILLN